MRTHHCVSLYSNGPKPYVPGGIGFAARKLAW